MKAYRPYNLRRKLLAAMVASCYAGAHAAPVNPTVVAGQASFNQQGKTFTITNTPNAIINWQGFSIGADEITRFIQQSSDSKVLNRVTGQDPSQILGSLQSNGKVFLINPNGVLFGAGARVDVNGLVASSLNISNADFLAGKNNFTAGDVAGKVANQGNITTPSGGQIFLIAPAVENSGIISAPNGDVVLAAGHSVQLFDSKDPNVQVVVSSPADQALNLGSIVAQGGRVGVYGALVNQRGAINANSAVRGENGKIVLKASGTTLVEAGSTTTATGSNLNTGGDIMLLGQKVGVTGNALVDVSGAAGGGTVLVGGDYQGKNAAVMNAQQAYVGKDAVLRANAADSGNGGKVVVWSDQATQMLGAISARGGARGGDGGQVETSGHYLDMRGTVDTRAPKGANGALLLDPSDVYIADSLSTATGYGMLCCNSLTSNGGLFLESGTVQDSLLLTSVLQTALATTNVTVSTANTHGFGSGTINVLSPLLWTSNRTLNLQADSNIALRAAISGINGALNMTAGGAIVQTTSPIDGLAVTNLTALAAGSITLQNSGNAISGLTTLTSNGGDIKLQGTSYTLGNTTAAGGLTLDASGTIGATGNVSVGGAFTLQSGAWIQNAATLPGFSAGDFKLNGGSFLRVKGGLGTLQSPFQLADIYGLQGVASQSLSRSYVLANDIDASASATWSGGFVPIASGGAYTGTFDGAGHIISGLKISRPGDDNVGMFSTVSTGAIRNLQLSGVNVTGHSGVGGLAGYLAGSTGAISNVTVSGDIEGVGNVGALVGNNAGLISNAISSGTVTGDGGVNASNIGGLVGVNTGAVSLSSSSAAVRGGGQGYTGGLVGSNTKNGSAIGSVTTSFATGAVYSSGEIVGGLVGDNNGGTVATSYATGSVNGGRNVGGLVGRNTNGGGISNAYATGNVSGNTDDGSVSHGNIGGLAGDLFDGSISNVYSTGTVTGNGFYNVHGLIGSVESGTLSNGYFNLTTAGTSSDTVGVALTTAQMQQQVSYDGFGFGDAWRIYNGHTTPLLKNFLTAVTVNVSGGDSVTKTYDGQSAAFTGTASGVPQSGVNGTLGFDGAVNAGTYSVGGLWSTQYDISYSGSNAQLTITPRTVTATVSATKTYDGVAYLEGQANYSFSNVVAGDTLGVRGTVRFNDKNVGSNKPLTVIDAVLSGNDYGNYVLGGVSGAGSITPATLTISGLLANSRTYDGTTVATLSGTPTISAFGADVVTLGGSGTASFSNKNVGSGKLVTLSGFTLGGADAGNYVLPTLTADITPALLTISGMTAASRVYNLDYDAASGTYGRRATVSGGTLQGVIGNEQVGFTGASGLFADKNVGSGKAVTVSGITLGGADAGNYVLAGAPSLAADITPATLTVTLAGKQYNNSAAGSFANATLGGVLSGGPQNASEVVSLVSDGATATYADKNVGVAKLVTVGGTPLSLSGADAGNYVLSSNVTGDITARPLATWIGTGPGLWSAASNWLDGVVPDGANVLAASLGSSAGLITYDASAGNTTVRTLTSGGAPLTISGGKLTLTGKGDLSSNLSGPLTLTGGVLDVPGELRAATAVLSAGTLSGGAGSVIQLRALNQSGGVIDSGGAVSIGDGGNVTLGNIRAQTLTLNAGETGSIHQTSGSQLVADAVSATASGDIALTNANNHVGAFGATVFDQGDIALTNTVLSGELALGALTATQGNIVIDNHGGIHTTGAITGGGLASITAHSPVTINNAVTADDIQLAASTEITLNGGSQLLANHTIGLTAGTNIQLGGVLAVQPGGSISAVATGGSISTLGGTVINSAGAAVTLSAPNGSVSTLGGTFGAGTTLTVNDGAAAAAAAAAAKAAADAAAAKAAADAAAKAAADAAAKAAADAAAKAAADAAAKAAADAAAKAAADAAAKAAADAAAKAAADAAAKAAADAAAKAAADAAAKAAADAAAKAASDAAAAQAAADAAAKAAADAAAKAAADAAAKAAADAAAKAAADAAAKAAADAAAKAAADAAAAAAAQGQGGQPVSEALNSTVNLINSATSTSQTQGGAASGGNSAPDAKTPDDKLADAGKADKANAKDVTKKMYCN